MITKISLENFKCFAEKKDLKMSRVSLLYGHNGRGKSSVSQALLLIGQSMKKRNDIDELFIVGDQIQLESFTDIKTANTKTNEIKFWIESGEEKLEIGFSPVPDKPQIGALSTYVINGENRFDVQTTQGTEHDGEQVKVAYSTSDSTILQTLKEIHYISAGRLGPVNDMVRNDTIAPNAVGTKGEYLINALSHQSPEFVEYVGQRLSEILNGGVVNIKDPSATRLELRLNSRDGKTLFRPINVGFGYSYVLPVIVSALLAEKGSILIVENPEAHLHPRAQSRIMEFLIEQALEKDLQLIIETHSDHVVNGMRISMKKNVLKPTDGIILHFAYGNDTVTPVITEITSDKEGNLSEYPEDFMDEWTAQMMQQHRLRLREADMKQDVGLPHQSN